MKNNYLFLIFLVSLTGTFAQAQVQFCGEPLPLDQPDVRQYWERSQSQKATLNQNLARLKQRIATVSPVIDPIMERYAIPKEFKYLPIVEGIRHPYSRSATERGGFWQLNPQTARRLGLMVAGRHRDQRYDLSRSTVAACRYLAQLHTEFGSWALVAAAYSLGPAAVRQARAQSPTMSVFSAAYHPEARSYLYPALVLKELVAGTITNPDRSGTASGQASAMRSLSPTISRRRGAANSLTDKPTSLSTLNESTSFRRVRTLREDVQTAPATPVNPVATPVAPAPSVVAAPAPVVAPKPTPVAVVAEPSLLIQSRSIGSDLLTDGQPIMFEVVSPQNLNGLRLAVGDLIYAHIETVNSSTGRVFLRADRLMSARTQESFRLNLIAVEKTRQPGVPMPARAGSVVTSGWRLAWEPQ